MVQSNRTWILGAVVLSIAIIVAGWFLGIQPQLTAAATANSNASDLDNSNALAQIELARLKAQDEALPTLNKQLALLQKSVPERASLDIYSKQLVDLAAANGVQITTLSFSDGIGFIPTATYAGNVPPDITDTNFVTVNGSVSVTGPRDNLRAFLAAAQLGTRLTVIPSATLAQGPDPASWGLDMTVTVFVLLPPDGTQEAIPPVDPNASPTPTPNPTDTSSPAPSLTPTPTPTP